MFESKYFNFRRISCVLTVLLMVAVSFTALLPSVFAGGTTTFSDGDDAKVFVLDGGTNTSTSFVVPGDSTILTATAKVSTVNGGPVTSPKVDIGDDGTVEWAFTGTGYGAFGHQASFSDGAPSMNASVRRGGTAGSFDILLPRNAQVGSATVDLKFKSRDLNIGWRYEDIGATIAPDYYSAPAFGDLDADGDLDLVVGSNSGTIYHFENDGDSAQFNWTEGDQVQNQAGNDIDVGYNSVPALADMDNDNDLDMIIGAGDGTMIYYENTGTSADPAWMNNNTLFGALDAGTYMAPALVDLDGDNDFDLVCGEYYGRIMYAPNTGSVTVPIFDQNPGNWGWVQDDGGVIDAGSISDPDLVDLDGDGDLDLFIGVNSGVILYKENIGTAASSNFLNIGYVGSLGNLLYIEYRAYPAFADLDGDSDLDLAVGSPFGSVYYWENKGTTSVPDLYRESIFGDYDLGDDGFPTLGDLDGDNDLDLIVGNRTGDLIYLKNDGNSTDPSFTIDGSVLGSLAAQADAVPQLVDYDGDGDLDLVVGNVSGVLDFYRNIGNANNPVFMEDTNIFGNQDFGSFIRPMLADLDGDGDLDLTVGDSWYSLVYYENRGTTENPAWTWDGDMYSGINTGGYRVAPLLYDFDLDGDHDLMIGNVYGGIVHYENTGGPQDTIWSTTGTPFSKIDSNMRSAPTMGDLDGDGHPDLLLSSLYAQLHYFRKVVYSDDYDIQLNIVGSSGDPIWTYSGTEPVIDIPIDITTAVQDHLSGATYDTDNFGNRISTLELEVPVTFVTADLGLKDVDITYSYTATMDDFTSGLNTYLSYHFSDVDDEGNLTIPVAVTSSSVGLLNISDIAITYDTPPVLVTPIPDLEVEEESTNQTLLDLFPHFDDEETSDGLLIFSIGSSTFNDSMVSLSIWNGRYLSVDAETGPGSPNWTGSGTVVLTAMDKLGNIVRSNEFMITITDVNDEPWITTEPVTTVLADTFYQYDVNASDVDVEDQLVYSLAISPEGMNINGFTGSITWMPTNADVGSHGIRVVVDDGEVTVEQTFSVTVEGNPATNHAPIFTSAPITTGFVGIGYEYDADAMDPDPGTELIFELVKAPSQMSVNERTGLVSWPDIINPYVGKHDIVLKVTDGVSQDHQNFTLIISLNPKSNHPPRFTSYPLDFAYPDLEYGYLVGVDDTDSLDRGNLMLEVELGPKGMKIKKDRTLTWTPAQEDMGGHLVILVVRDLAGAEARQSFTLNVIQVKDQMAVLILSPENDEKVNGDFKVVGTLNSTLMNAITSVQVRIDGKDWEDATGTGTWSYSVDGLTVGRHQIEARAYDGKNYSAISSIKVNVREGDGTALEGLAGMLGVIALLVVLLVVLTILSFIIGKKKGRASAAQELTARPKPLTPEAEEVRAGEEEFQRKVYEGKEIGPEEPGTDEGGFRGRGGLGKATGYEEEVPADQGYEGQAYQEEAYDQEPVSEGPYEEKPPASAQEDAPPGEEGPEPGPPKEDTGATTSEKPAKKDEKESKAVLDDILKKLTG